MMAMKIQQRLEVRRLRKMLVYIGYDDALLDDGY